MKIGILTGGGDVPGLNPCIRAIVNRAIDEGHEVIGIRRGLAGLLNYNRDDETKAEHWVAPLDKHQVRSLDGTGGTFLHTSRLNPSQVKPIDIPQFLRNDNEETTPDKSRDFTEHVLENITYLELDVLIPIGGDDTLSYAYRLHTEGVPIIAIPKTMDNDIYGTDYCIGFSTAITRSVQFVHDVRRAVGAHERIGVVELFGRNSGETALISAYLADADRAIISEVPFDPERLAALLVEDKRNNPNNYALMTISEGASMMGGKRAKYSDGDDSKPIGMVTSEIFRKVTDENIIYQQVAYLMRSGMPDAIDLMVGFNFANMALDLAEEGSFGQMVAIKDGKYTNISIDTLSMGVKRVDVDELYDVQAYRPKVRHVNQKPMFLY
ncbi:6-phosphofructokinase [Anaerolineales bacterium HSG25]|nr:6-phosphofructokinase [Anaerolineales bacterium HSG25]